MPQLAVTGNQEDPLTQRHIFFFKCKHMHSLENTKTHVSGVNSKVQKEDAVQCVVCLFAALSEADSHALTGEKFPDRGRLAWPQPRFVACRQRILLE